jgi:hypothetical protein
MRFILSSILVLAGVVAAAAQTNRPAALLQRPVDYSGRVQMHNVPLSFKSPDELQREEEQDAKTGQLQRKDKPPELMDLKPAVAPMQVLPPRMPAKRKEEDPDWRNKLGSPHARDTKEEPSGWGWLADEVRQADKKRAGSEEEQTKQDREEDQAGGITSQMFSANESWSGIGRPEPRDAISGAGRNPPPFDSLRASGNRDAAPEQPTPDPTAGMEGPGQDVSRQPLLPDIREQFAPSPREYPSLDAARLLNLPSLGAAQPEWAMPNRAASQQASLFEQPLASRMLEPVLSSPTPMAASVSEPTPIFPMQASTPAASPVNSPAGNVSPFGGASPVRPTLGSDPAMPGIQTKTLPW